MINPPRTASEAYFVRYPRTGAQVRYHTWSCVYETHAGWQCTRNSGHGFGGLYCKPHAEKVRKYYEKNTKQA